MNKLSFFWFFFEIEIDGLLLTFADNAVSLI